MKVEQAPKLEKVKTYSIITLFLVVVGSAVSFWVANRIKYYTDALHHTEEVLRTTDQLYASILERETSIRGYVLTGEEAFLENHKNSSAEGEKLMNRIIFLTSDNSTQQDLLKKLRQLVYKRGNVFERSIEYYEIFSTMEGFISPGKTEDAVKGYFQIKLLVNQINEEEERRLIERNEILIDNIQALPLIVGMISFFSVLMGVITLYSIYRYNRASKANDENIKRYQDILNEKIVLLNESNNELKHFAYIASHDLQEPLRKITSFADLLKEQFDEKLEGEGKYYMDRITASANRMRQLITDLLEYSRAGRDSIESVERIPLEEILDSVLDDLEISIEEKNAKIRYENLPIINGKETELRQVFQNLISNSLKFSKPELAPDISITSTDAPIDLVAKFTQLDQSISYYLIKVVDNGIGFDQAYGDSIFIIFQRLHGKNEFEGTGIGLSIARKIIENNNGLILAEGKLGIGATFKIIIPKP
jgi:signal transduction histidine kinase